MNARILCVDDEPRVLRAHQRQLYGQFDITVAGGGAEALETIATQGPFAVVVSDLRMPGMDGVQLLSEVRKRTPDCVRIMLTGFADLETTVEAVNEGNVFRFLTKPCTPEAFAHALNAAVAQYRLVTAEKELLERTLRGAIKVLAEVLSLTNPVAFGHASRVQRLATTLCRRMQVTPSWPVEIAAMLSQIGCVTVPADVLEKDQHGTALQPTEAQMMEAHPAIAGDLIRNIPRLEEVAHIVTYQNKCFDGSGTPRDAVHGEGIPLGARILKVAIDCDKLALGGCCRADAPTELRRHSLRYDPAVLDALEAEAGAARTHPPRRVALRDVTLYAILAEDVRTPQGCLLIGKGQEITPSVFSLLQNYARRQGLTDQIMLTICVDH